MVIEINKDIDRYQETVALGLTAKQLIYSVISVGIGAAIVLLLYKHIGLTASAYVAIPCVAPIALGGFYSYNGMSFFEYMGKKIHFMTGNKALLYESTESEKAIKKMQLAATSKKKTKGAEPCVADNAIKKQDEFEASVRRMKKMLIVSLAVIIVVVAALIAYKYFMK